MLGLALDGSKLDGVVLRRTNGALQRLQSFSAQLTLDPLTAAPELVGREIRNQLDAAGVRPHVLLESVAENEEHRTVLRSLDLRSYMGIPLALRGNVFGVISFFSADPNRCYDMLDLAMAEDLAHRTTVAVENSLLFGLFVRPNQPSGGVAGQEGLGRTLAQCLVEKYAAAKSLPTGGEEITPNRHFAPPSRGGGATQGTAEETPVAAKGRRILVVEDNVGTAKILSRLLAKLGNHEVHVVHDGLAALNAAAKHRPEIVFLDIGLPRMNGYEVARRLRRQPEFQTRC